MDRFRHEFQHSRGVGGLVIIPHLDRLSARPDSTRCEIHTRKTGQHGQRMLQFTLVDNLTNFVRILLDTWTKTKHWRVMNRFGLDPVLACRDRHSTPLRGNREANTICRKDPTINSRFFSYLAAFFLTTIFSRYRLQPPCCPKGGRWPEDAAPFVRT